MPTDVTIATYNILNLPGSDSIEEALPRTMKLVGHIKDMGSPDVVALQEVQVPSIPVLMHRCVANNVYLKNDFGHFIFIFSHSSHRFLLTPCP